MVRATRYSIIALFFTLTFGLTSQAAEVTSRDLIHIMINSHKLPLDPQLHPGCHKDFGRTLGEAMSNLLAKVAGTTNKLEAVCSPYETGSSPFKASKRSTVPTECRLSVLVTEPGGEAMRHVLITRLTPNGRLVERKFIACEKRAN